jgi:hypothetical protein
MDSHAKSSDVKNGKSVHSQSARSHREPALQSDAISNLLLEALELEMGGERVYLTALECAQNSDLQQEWKKYFRETQRHTQVLRGLCTTFGLDPDQPTPGRKVVRHLGESLVKAMQLAKSMGAPASAELVAAECVTFAETKDHLNWELLGTIARALGDGQGRPLTDACRAIEAEEDEHLYHTAGWTRELWLQSLGLPSQLPPPEEREDVQSMEEAARVQNKRSEEQREH